MQQLGHHRKHAVEVPGARGALELGAQRARVQLHQRAAVRVDLAGLRREHDVRTGAGQDPDIGVQGARVAFEVRGVVELELVDEDADHQHVVLRAGRCHQ